MKNIFIPMARIYFRLRSLWPVWFYMLNRESRSCYKRELPILNDTEKKIISAFRKNGIAITHLDELFPQQNFLSVLNTYTRKLASSADTRTSKEFLRNLFETVPEVDFSNPFLPLVLEERILNIVNSYMDLCVKLYYLTLNITIPVVEGVLPVQSQQWHRDPEDKKLVKVFLYLNNVDEEAGPFIYVPGSQYGGKFGSIFPQQPPRGSSYINDKRLEQFIPKEYILKCTGRAGTIIFCDTTGLHKGGYARAKERLMFTAGYCTSASAWPKRYRTTENFKNMLRAAPLSSKALYALNFSPGAINTYFLKKIKKNLLY